MPKDYPASVDTHKRMATGQTKIGEQPSPDKFKTGGKVKKPKVKKKK